VENTATGSATRRHRLLCLALVAASALLIVTVSGARPALCPQREAAGDQAGAAVKFNCSTEGCREIKGTHSGVAGQFVSGEIDLTGDGVPEVVTLKDAEIAIVQDGAEVWRSEPTWTVVDAALGDPNQDGRFEVLLAFWRDDAAGVPRSQPFIVGYREGQYRTLWGGSPVTEPLHEVLSFWKLGTVAGPPSPSGAGTVGASVGNGVARKAPTVIWCCCPGMKERHPRLALWSLLRP
jgi:hypothetical protein